MEVVATASDIDKIFLSRAEVFQALFTSFLTVLSGTFLYLLKIAIDEHCLFYIREYKKIKAEIAYNLVKYANVYTQPVEELNPLSEEASTTFRDLASRVAAFIEIRSKLCIFIPDNKIIREASSHLIGLSNGMYGRGEFKWELIKHNKKHVQSIRKLLEICEFEKD